MTAALRLLVVEDDQKQLIAWQEKVEMHNAEWEKIGYEIELTTAESLREARQLITNRKFDAAVVDVRLRRDSGVGPNADGNEVLKLILDSELAVAALYTGEAQVANKPETNPYIEVFSKGAEEGGGLDAVMEWLDKHVPMINQIRNAHSEIQAQMAKLFSHSIWPRWQEWIHEENDEIDFIRQSLVRHITSHIYASFLEAGGQRVHPEEWYFIPPVRDGLRTGDVLRHEDGKIEVVITPRCDLARNGKNETFQLAECMDVSNAWDELCENVVDVKAKIEANQDPEKIPKLEKRLAGVDKELRQFAQHKSNSSVYHFLPRMRLTNGEVVGPFFIRFDKIRSLSRLDDNVRETLANQRIATLTPEFLPSMVERLGAYFSRIGTPDYSHPE